MKPCPLVLAVVPPADPARVLGSGCLAAADRPATHSRHTHELLWDANPLVGAALIIPQKQLADIRCGKITTAFIPQSVASKWTVGHRVRLRKLVVVEENYRRTVPIKELFGENEGRQVAVALVAVGDPVPFADVTIKDARRAGFLTRQAMDSHRREIYSRRQQRENVVPIVFSYADDRPRLLTAKAHTLSASDYTTSPRKAMRGEPEVMVVRR